MRVAPDSSASSLHIAKGQVHTSYESHLAVYHTQLAVVAIVHLAGKGRKPYRHKGMNIYSNIAHTLKEGIADAPTAHIIIYQTYLHTLPGLVCQSIGYQISQGVVLYDIGIYMDVLLRPADGLQQTEHETIAIGINLHLIVFERERPVLVGKEAHQGLAVGRQMQVFLLSKLQHRALGELVHRTVADESLLTDVLPEEHIEHDAEKGHKEQHHNPGYGLRRLFIIHQYRHDGGDGKQRIH